MKDWAKLFDEESPTEDSLSLQILKGQIFMVGVNMEFTTAKQHCAILFESFNNGQKLFFANGVIALCRIELAPWKIMEADGVPDSSLLCKNAWNHILVLWLVP
jgi:hypothetical protein